MASQAYYDWIAAGSPYVRARPTLELRDLLRSYGYTVYDYPNAAHLTADRPEDHTPFSATGWPVTSKRWVGHAIDIMPPTTTAIAKGAIELPYLARRVIAAKDAKVHGTEWIKYLNWTDESGVCRHVSWQPDKSIVSSTDKGHIHISGRSDMDTSDVVSTSGWNPLEDDDMAMSDVEWNTGWMVQGLVAMADPIVIPANKNTVPPAAGATLPNKVAQALKAIAAKTGLTEDEIATLAGQIAADVVEKVDIPTAQENADAVVAEIAS